MVELVKFPTIPLLYMTENTQRDIDFYRKAFRINAMAIAWDVLVVFDREIRTNAINYPKGFRFLNCSWRKDREIACLANQLYPENFLRPLMMVTI